MYSVGIYTLGCKVSQYESEAIAERFLERGFSVLDFTEKCDAYVINTCTVTAESDRKSRQIIRRAVKNNPEAVVAVIGCYSQRSPKRVADIPGVSIVIGTQDKLSVVPRVEEMLKNRKKEKYISAPNLEGATFEEMTVRHAPRTRAYVKIEDGCNSKCAYCAIKDARGRVRSKRREDVISEVEALARSGVKEVVLTGIETGHYGLDFDYEYTLGDLIRELDERGAVERIRLGSLAPELIGEKFTEKIKGVRSLCPHFHISMQSGSDRVLALMRRRYNAKTAMKNIERLREIFPKAAFTADLMVGFPYESEDDFLETVRFVKEARLIDAHVFAFSRREGTEAYGMAGQIDEATKSRRSRELIRAKDEVRDEVLTELVECGEPLSFVLETYSRGEYTAHAENYAEAKIRLEAGRQGEVVMAVPVSHKDGILTAVLVDKM